jgi:cytochrome P450
MLSRFIQTATNESGTVDFKYLRDIILNIVIAGKDTTAGALAWFLYMACKHPEVQEKVREEARMATGASETATVEEFAQSLTDEALNKMHYLHAALTETLRLYPSVPLVSPCYALLLAVCANLGRTELNMMCVLDVSQDNKQCFGDDVLPDGSSVNKGDIVFYVPYAMGRMEYLWGEDAGVFRPERWLDGDSGEFQQQSPFKFTAFQAGPRICLGKEFAYRQMKIFAAVLLRSFALRLRDGEDATVNYRTMITLHIDQGLHLTATAR